MGEVRVRYLVDEVGVARDFYVERLGFELIHQPAEGFAMLGRGDLRLMLNAVGAGGGGRAAGEGERPRPGGWNRIQLLVDDLDAEHERLQQAGVAFRGGVVVGRGGRQVLVRDPSGNVVELFEPADG